MANTSVALTQSRDGVALPLGPANARNLGILLALLAVALFTRSSHIGDPAVHLDEEFYLLVGDRMWHGALPYVDIWDRKPIGLFLIYAALRPFSTDGIVAYQIGALLFAALTAFFIVLIARRLATATGAFLAGAAYLLYLPLLGGAGGQTPVFYNLFLVIGAWEVVRAGEDEDAAAIFGRGLRSMLWAGLAIQVKYTAAIDGMAFGLWLIVLSVRRGAPWPRIAGRSALWIAMALAPTLVAAGFYVAIGHGYEFLQANFLSILQKQQPANFPAVKFLEMSGLNLQALLLIVAFALVNLRRHRIGTAPVQFVLLWGACAVADFFSIGGYYEHYALPLLAPAMVLCAPLLGTAIGGTLGMALFGWFAFLFMAYPTEAAIKLNRGRVAAMVELARPYTAYGCIYVNDGPPVVYLLTHSCLPSRFAFPCHLHDATEALATNATENMTRLIASRPPAIFVPDKASPQPPNPVTGAMLADALARDYRHVATVPDVNLERMQLFYVRKDLLPQRNGNDGAP